MFVRPALYSVEYAVISLGVRYGAAAREFVLHQKAASILIVVALVAIFVAIG
jgi:hypothetical protein